MNLIYKQGLCSQIKNTILYVAVIIILIKIDCLKCSEVYSSSYKEATNLNDNNTKITNSLYRNITCDTKICDEEGGTCINDTVCQCKESHTTLPNEASHKLCNYAKRSRMYAAFLELFVGFGVGHFYAGRKVNGYLKLMLFIILCCISCCSMALAVKFQQEHPDVENSAVKFFFFIYAVISNLMISWQVFDFFMFIFRFYNDGSDIPFA